jgi:hypothetical protein
MAKIATKSKLGEAGSAGSNPSDSSFATLSDGFAQYHKSPFNVGLHIITSIGFDLSLMSLMNREWVLAIDLDGRFNRHLLLASAAYYSQR